MPAPAALIVGETPSLARSIRDLLDAGSVRVEHVDVLDEVGPLREVAARFPVVIAAASGPYCTTARAWAQGRLPGTALVVVGSRDPAVARLPGVHPVPLPLDPEELLALVQRLLRAGADPPATRGAA